MFKEFLELLQVHEQINFQIRKTDDNQLDVIIIGKLKEADLDKMDADTASIRSALSTPLRMVDTPEILNENLLNELQEFVPLQINLNNTLSILQQTQTKMNKAVVKAESNKSTASTVKSTTKAKSSVKKVDDSKTDTPVTKNQTAPSKSISQPKASTTSLF